MIPIGCSSMEPHLLSQSTLPGWQVGMGVDPTQNVQINYRQANESGKQMKICFNACEIYPQTEVLPIQCLWFMNSVDGLPIPSRHRTHAHDLQGPDGHARHPREVLVNSFHLVLHQQNIIDRNISLVGSSDKRTLSLANRMAMRRAI